MNIYFSCSLTGGRRDETIYQAMVDHLLAGGHEVPTAHLAEPEVMSVEHTIDPESVYQRDIRWISNCDAIVAEVSTPSHGVGYEIAYGLNLGKPVLCCHRKDTRVSKMITGNDSPCLVVRPYHEVREVFAWIDEFLAELE